MRHRKDSHGPGDKCPVGTAAGQSQVAGHQQTRQGKHREPSSVRCGWLWSKSCPKALGVFGINLCVSSLSRWESPCKFA